MPWLGIAFVAGADGPAPPGPLASELARIDAGFVAACLGVAHGARTAGDADLERRALEAVQAVDPGHVESRTRLAGLGAEVEALFATVRRGPHVPSWVGAWQELVGDGSFGEAAAAARVLSVPEGHGYHRPERGAASGPRYVLDLEVRVVEAKPGWMLGLILGGAGGGTCCAFVNTENVVVDETQGEKAKVLGSTRHTGWGLGTWRRLAVVADGGRLEVWLDGQPMLRSLAPKDVDLDGEISLVRRGCRFEVKSLAIGRPR